MRRIREVACTVLVLVALSVPASASGALSHYVAAGATAASSNEHLSLEFLGVTCTSPHFCLLIGERVVVDRRGDEIGMKGGEVFWSDAPAGGRETWRAVDVGARTGFGGFTGPVACPSSRLCVAAGGGGSALVTTDDPTRAKTWSPATIPGYPDGVDEMSCSSQTLCVATDGGELLDSTMPVGGAQRWDAVGPLDPNLQISGLSCVSTHLCVAVDNYGNVLESTEPTNLYDWHKHFISSGASLYDVSCSSRTLCIASNSANAIVVSTDPTGDRHAWSVGRPLVKDHDHAFYAVTCTSNSLCAALDETGGEVFTSSRPTAQALPWRASVLGSGLDGVACPSVRLCLVSSRDGLVYTSTNPGARSPRWTEARFVN